MHAVVYIGNSLNAIIKLQDCKDIKLIAILCDKRRESEEMRLYAETIEIEYQVVSKAEEIKGILDNWKFEFVIMYSFGLIISDIVIEKYQIFNFHPGDLRTNRGSTPVNWSIVLGDYETRMVLYRLITAGIDLGEVVSERRIEISDDDNVFTLRNKLEALIPWMMDDLMEFLSKGNKGRIITDGIYRPRIAEKDYTINVNKDSKRDIQKKIRSQEIYDGAVLPLKDGNVRIKTWEQYESMIRELSL